MKNFGSSFVFLIVFLSLTSLASASDKTTPAEKTKPRVVLIGLDALGFDMINYGYNQGLIPHIKSIMDRGSYGPLTALPGTQASQWESIVNGFRPTVAKGKPALQPNPKHKRTPGFQAKKAVPIWRILSSEGYKVGISGFQTSDQQPLNGYEVSFYAVGRGPLPPRAPIERYIQEGYAPNWAPTLYDISEPGLHHPPEFASVTAKIISDIESKGPAHLLATYPFVATLPKGSDLAVDLLYALTSMDISKNISLTLLQKSDLDFVATILWGIDVAGHRGFTKDILGPVDAYIGQVLTHIDDNTHVILVSNHAVTIDHNERASDAFIMGMGPAFKKGVQIKGAVISDVMPTVLHLFGLSTKQPLEGQVLTGMLKEQSAPAPKLVDTAPLYAPTQMPEPERSKMVKATRDRLKMIMR